MTEHRLVAAWSRVPQARATLFARGLPVWGALAAVLVAGCGGGSGKARAPALRQPSDTAARTEGCIDTPFIGGDEQATRGIQCGREASGDAAALSGRVLGESLPGLPGAGVEGLWVGVHSLGEGAVNLAALPAPVAETTTGPQGRFSLLASGAGELLVVVRDQPGGRLLAAQRLAMDASKKERGAINLVVDLAAP